MHQQQSHHHCTNPTNPSAATPAAWQPQLPLPLPHPRAQPQGAPHPWQTREKGCLVRRPPHPAPPPPEGETRPLPPCKAQVSPCLYPWGLVSGQGKPQGSCQTGRPQQQTPVAPSAPGRHHQPPGGCRPAPAAAPAAAQAGCRALGRPQGCSWGCWGWSCEGCWSQPGSAAPAAA